MAHHLLVIRTTLDELPIGLFPSRVKAFEAIDRITLRQINKSARLMRVDSAGVVVAAIIRFDKGVPTDLEIHDIPDRVTEAIDRAMKRYEKKRTKREAVRREKESSGFPRGGKAAKKTADRNPHGKKPTPKKKGKK